MVYPSVCQAAHIHTTDMVPQVILNRPFTLIYATDQFVAGPENVRVPPVIVRLL